jgi:hypothetical protein
LSRAARKTGTAGSEGAAARQRAAAPRRDRFLRHPEESPHPGDFPGLGTLSYALLAFVHRYNRTARPFNWKFTADDLTALLRRISQREQAASSQQTTLPQAA